MTVAVICPDCGEDVTFRLDGVETDPQETCDSCEQTYELTVEKVM